MSDIAELSRKPVTAWHSVGITLGKGEKINDAIERAGLNSELIPCETHYKDPKGKFIQDNSRISWVRSTDGQLIARSANGWKPLQNKDAVNAMDEWCRAAGVDLSVIGQINRGRTIFALANLGKGFGPQADRTNIYGLLTSNHVVGMANTVKTLNVRLICLNGATSTSEAENYRQSHSNPFNIEAARKVVMQMIESTSTAEKRAAKLRKFRLTPEDAITMLAPIWTPKHEVDGSGDRDSLPRVLKEILHSYENAPGAEQGTAWGAYNAVTHWTTHVAGNSPATRLFRSWMGDYSRKVAATEKALLELAE